MKILVVDDNPDDRKLLRFIIERNGHEIVEAGDGLAGLAKAKSAAPDLIISDALMPVMDGFQFLREVKQEPELRSLPFIFYSSSYKDFQDVRLAMSLGADAYLIKPLDPVELWAKIETLLAASTKEKTPVVPLIKEDAEYLKRYSEVVATKLEEKVRELERTLEDRKRAEEALLRSEEHLRSLYVNSPLAYQCLDADGRFLDVNPAWTGMMGFESGEVAGKSFAEFLAPASAAQFRDRFALFKKQGEVHGEEFEVARKDGRRIEVELNGRIGCDEEGNFSQMHCLLSDVTERHRAERERLASLKFFESMDRINRAIQKAGSLEEMMSAVLDDALSIFDCDRAFLMYPCDPDAACWQVPMERSRPEYAGVLVTGQEIPMDPDTAQILRVLLNSEGPVTFGPGAAHPLPAVVSERLGFQSFLSMALYPYVDRPWLFGLHHCSAPRTWTAEEERLFQEIGRRLSDGLSSLLTRRDLKKSEQFLNSIVENLPNMLVVKDARTLNYVSINRAGENLLGYSREELIGKCDHDFFPKEQADFFTAKDRDVLNANRLVDIPEETMQTRDMGERTLRTKKIPLPDEAGKPQYLLGISEDITERRSAQAALEKSEAFIKNILESVDEGFIVVDRNYRILSANRAFCALAKLPEDRVVGRFCYEVSHHANRPCFDSGEDCAVRRTFATGLADFATHVHTDAKGAKQYVEIKSYAITDAAGSVVSVIETLNDATEKKRLEEQLRQAQKMEAIGTLAGGVAHDFNNILTAIIGYANIVKMKMKPDDPQRLSIDQILKSSDRAAHLTQGLLAFSRKQVLNSKPVDLNGIVRSIQKLLARLIGEDIDLSTLLAQEDLIVLADAGQIEQVLMNLATNARDAMPEGGALTIATQAIELNQDFINAHGFGKPGRYALIAVSDSGAGMDEQTREKIFEPFFTTKEPGKGTGLGLAIVYGIIKQHNGHINVYSEPGKGSTFKIYLPLLAAQVEEANSESAALPARGTETILLAEDDQTVRDLTVSVLKDFGYQVIEAVDGQDAVDQFSKHAEEVALLILDVIMPKKNGKEAYAAIDAIRPGVPALFISGYTADSLQRRGLFEKDIEFVSKPASPFEMVKKVRELLDRKKKQP